MKFAEDLNNAKYKITGYETEGVLINGIIHSKPFILSPMEFIDDWQPSSINELKVEHLDSFYPMKPEVILLGTGVKQVFPDREILKYLVENRIGYEIMDTQAACRTFNIIMSEGRTVVVGMFI